MWEVSGSGMVVRVDTGVVIYEAMTSQHGRPVVQVLLVRVDVGVVTYEAMTPQCGRSVVHIIVVRVDIGVVAYKAMTPQYGSSVVQVLVISPVWEFSGSSPGCQSGYMSGDL